MKSFILTLLATFTLTACETPYQKYSRHSNVIGGYTDLALSKDTYMVTMRTNQHTLPEKTFTMLFYRAAEIAQENGAQYFKVEDFQTNRSVNTHILPGWSSSNTSGNITYDPYMESGTFNAQSNAMYMPPQTIQSQSINMQVVIKLIRNSAKDDKDNLMDTKFVLENWQVQ